MRQQPKKPDRIPLGMQEPTLPEEEQEKREHDRRCLNTSPDNGNTTNNPGNNITSRLLSDGLEL